MKLVNDNDIWQLGVEVELTTSRDRAILADELTVDIVKEKMDVTIGVEVRAEIALRAKLDESGIVSAVGTGNERIDLHPLLN